ncbi:MAG: hypothetical protein ABI839_05640 [Verrucomicrobiota bacterium]
MFLSATAVPTPAPVIPRVMTDSIIGASLLHPAAAIVAIVANAVVRSTAAIAAMVVIQVMINPVIRPVTAPAIVGIMPGAIIQAAPAHLRRSASRAGHEMSRHPTARGAAPTVSVRLGDPRHDYGTCNYQCSYQLAI